MQSHKTDEKTRRPATRPATAKILSALAVFTILCSAELHAAITKGPVLLRLYPGRAAVMWETDIAGEGKVAYGRGEQLNYRILTRPDRLEYRTHNGQEKTAFIHKSWLVNLKPGCAYSYRIIADDAQSDIYTFHTPGADANRTTFVVYGDTRTNTDIHRKIVEQIIDADVDFVVHTGDLVSNGDDYSVWGPQFFDVVKGLAESTPMYIAKGNHEGRNGNYERLLLPGGERNNYTFDSGPVHYFCADNYSRTLATRNLIDSIATELRTSQARWKFVSYHIPSVNFGGHFSDWGSPEVFDSFAKAGADFVITGHSHQYERFRPFKPAKGTKGSFVTYITAGGGAAPLYSVTATAYHAVAKSIHHFCLFKVAGSKLSMDAIDVNGAVFDHLELTRTDGALDRQYLQQAVPTKLVYFHQLLHRTLPVPLAAQPRKGQPFAVEYKVSVPPLPDSVELTFSLSCDEGDYKPGESRTVTIPKTGGPAAVRLDATALVEAGKQPIQRRALQPLNPPLRLDCRYRIGKIQQTVSCEVTAKSE